MASTLGGALEAEAVQLAGEESAREEFSAFFKAATREERSPEGHDPYPFQIRLALADELPELIDIPTGLGKTDAVVLAWLWRRRFAGPDRRRHAPAAGVLPAHEDAGGADKTEAQDVAGTWVASALAWLQIQGRMAKDADLVAYLIDAHHGKIRMSIISLDKEKHS